MKKMKLFGITLLLFAAMIIIWNSCTKKEEIHLTESETQISKFEKALQDFKQNNPRLSFENSLEYRSTPSGITSCWDPDSVDCNGDMEYEGSDTLIIDLYSNCKALVTYDLWNCWYEIVPGSGNVSFTYYFDNFTATPVDGECDSVSILWNSLYNQGLLDSLEESYQIFVNDARNLAEYLKMAEFLNSPVGLFFKCTYGNNLLQSNFFIASCYQAFWKGTIKGGVFRTERITSPCGESCCKSTKKYCLTNSGNIFVTPPYIEQIGNCDGYLEIPPIGYYPVGNCEHDCD